MMAAVRRALIAALYRVRGNRTLSRLAEFERSQWLSRERMAALQLERLRDLLAHAGEIPFWRERFRRADFDPRDVRSPQDLRVLPPLERDEIRERVAEMVDPNVPEASRVANATGGSSGTPVRFYQDRNYQETKVAYIYRNFRWTGWNLGEPHAFIWGADIDSREHEGSSGRLRDWLYNVNFCNAFGIGTAELDRFLRRLEAHQPKLLIGYASSLGELEDRARRAGSGARVAAIVSSAEVLDPGLRARLEETFGAKVFDRYGAREVSTIAFECPTHTGLHTMDDSNLVEIDGTSGGEVLVTNLVNRTMPLIRYRVGDRAGTVEGPCPCGRGLGRMTPVSGRVGEYLVAPSGRRIHGEFFTHLFYGSTGVRRFEVVQVSDTDLVVRIVKNDAFDPLFEDRLRKAIHDHGDAGFRVRFEYPPEIVTTASGKLRFVRREIAS